MSPTPTATRPARPAERWSGRAPLDVSGPAWIVRTVTHVPGVLTLRAGRLSFRSTRHVVFDVALDDVRRSGALAVGGFGRRGTFRLVVDGELLRVHVVRPSGGVPVPAELAGPGSPVPSAQEWRAALSGPAERDPAHGRGRASRSSSTSIRRATATVMTPSA